MPIRITCSACGKKLQIRDELVGKKVKCPACGIGFRVEAAGAAPAGLAQPGPGSAARDKVSAKPPPLKVPPPDENNEDEFEERRVRSRAKKKRREAPSLNLMWIGIGATVALLMVGVGGILLFLRPAVQQAAPIAQNQPRQVIDNENDPAPAKKARQVNAKDKNDPGDVPRPTPFRIAGPKVRHGNYEVFFTDGATRQEADRLGAHLLKAGDAPQRASVHLKKMAGGYQFRMVVRQEFQNDTAILTRFQFDVARISRDVFEGAAVEFHVCDAFMKTLQVFPPRADVRYGVVEDKAEVFFASATDKEDALRLAKHLAQLFKESPTPVVSFKLARRGETVEVHMATRKEVLNQAVLADLGRMRGDIAAKVFMGASVEMHLCDDLFQVFQVLQK